MKLFSWVQNKLSGSQSITKPNNQTLEKNPNAKSRDEKEEFSDWPHGILSIGTLFNKTSKDDTKEHNNNDDHQENSPASPKNLVHGLTSDQVKQLQKELKELDSSIDIDCLSSSEVDRESNIHSSHNTEMNYEEECDDQHYEIVPNRAKDVCLDNNISNNAISKRSVSFLLKKMFVCGGGLALAPTPSLRDPTLSPPQTRMNKILRAILRKKIYPQSSCQTMVGKRYLKSGQTGSNNYENDDEDYYIEGENDKSKWVKSDTEYIVLEI